MKDIKKSKGLHLVEVKTQKDYSEEVLKFNNLLNDAIMTGHNINEVVGIVLALENGETEEVLADMINDLYKTSKRKGRKK